MVADYGYLVGNFFPKKYNFSSKFDFNDELCKFLALPDLSGDTQAIK